MANYSLKMNKEILEQQKHNWIYNEFESESWLIVDTAFALFHS